MPEEEKQTLTIPVRSVRLRENGRFRFMTDEEVATFSRLIKMKNGNPEKVARAGRKIILPSEEQFEEVKQNFFEQVQRVPGHKLTVLAGNTSLKMPGDKYGYVASGVQQLPSVEEKEDKEEVREMDLNQDAEITLDSNDNPFNAMDEESREVQDMSFDTEAVQEEPAVEEVAPQEEEPVAQETVEETYQEPEVSHFEADPFAANDRVIQSQKKEAAGVKLLANEDEVRPKFDPEVLKAEIRKIRAIDPARAEEFEAKYTAIMKRYDSSLNTSQEIVALNIQATKMDERTDKLKEAEERHIQEEEAKKQAAIESATKLFDSIEQQVEDYADYLAPQYQTVKSDLDISRRRMQSAENRLSSLGLDPSTIPLETSLTPGKPSKGLTLGEDPIDMVNAAMQEDSFVSSRGGK